MNIPLEMTLIAVARIDQINAQKNLIRYMLNLVWCREAGLIDFQVALLGIIDNLTFAKYDRPNAQKYMQAYVTITSVLEGNEYED